MDMIAEQMGIDPVEFRMRNAIDNPAPGTVYKTVNGVLVETCGIKESLQLVAEDNLWKERNELPKKQGSIAWGTGLSATSYSGGARQQGHQSCAAIVRVCEDGTVNLLTGATDCGQGSDTVLCAIAAEELGVELNTVSIKRVDTAYTPVDPGSYGSRVTILAGQATQFAAREARKQLVAAAAQVWNVNPDDIVIKKGSVSAKSDPEKTMPFERLARVACYSGTGAVILGTGYSRYGLEPLDLVHGTGNNGTSYSFTAQSARVGVDLETGKIITSDFTIASDCGRLLCPVQAEGQIEGAAVQGLSQTIYEDFVFDKGRTLNATLMDYKMPRSTDVPNIKLIDVVTDDPGGPFGAKETSEGSIVSTPPAVVSAIHDATGVWFKELPVTPEMIVKALRGKK
jgi:CO/xanthine dehydrogenase Mo-binding subunit